MLAVQTNVRYRLRRNVKAVIADPTAAIPAVIKVKLYFRVCPFIRLVVLPSPEQGEGAAPRRRVEAFRVERIFFTLRSGPAAVTPKDKLKAVLR